VDLAPKADVASSRRRNKLFQGLCQQESVIVTETDATPLVNASIGKNVRDVVDGTGGTTLCCGLFTAFSCAFTSSCALFLIL